MSDDEEIPRDLCDLNAEILETEVFVLQERCAELERQSINNDRPDVAGHLRSERNRLINRIKQVRRLEEYFK